MSWANVRVNTSTFTWRSFLFLLFPKTSFQFNNCSIFFAENTRHKKLDCSKEKILASARNYPLSHNPLWWENDMRETVSHFSCLFKWDKQKHGQKKCQLAINLPLCSCPNPPVSPLIPLFFLHLFFTISLFSARGQYRLGHTLASSHELSHSPRCTGYKHQQYRRA